MLKIKHFVENENKLLNKYFVKTSIKLRIYNKIYK